jgi:hypothetical protein
MSLRLAKIKSPRFDQAQARIPANKKSADAFCTGGRFHFLVEQNYKLIRRTNSSASCLPHTSRDSSRFHIGAVAV